MTRSWGKWALAVVLALAHAAGLAQTATLELDHAEYHPGEAITAAFSGGPANRRDWVGIYPEGVVPGSQGSTLWRYVDGTTGGSTGLGEGNVRFGSGLAFAGAWTAFLLLNDGYGVLAQTNFLVVDAFAPLVRRSRASYAPGDAIGITFTNGPANPKDWIGVYPEDVLPGAASSLLWRYTDGTTSGSQGVANATVTFGQGLSKPGRYVAYLLENDGYNILAREPITVVQPLAAPPKLAGVQPADGATNGAPTPTFNATILPGSGQVLESGVSLAFNGVPVTPVVDVQADRTLVSYAGTALLPPGSRHSFRLVARNTTGLQFTNEVLYTVDVYTNVVLPPPIVFENFDSVAEGSLPAGWSRRSYTEVMNPESDLGNLDSAAYATWSVVNSDRFLGSFVTYSNPENPASWAQDYRRVLHVGTKVIVNGAQITRLATGGMLFGNSGYRNGRSQVLFVETPDFNLSGKTNIHLAFHALWEQNQDSIATVEYSIDGGASWLPVLYLLDVLDIDRTETGAVDVAATLGTERGDIARYTDDAGNDIGGTYGAFVSAPVSEALAPFIEARIDDDSRDGKRMEVRALPAAANQSRVRVRFGHAGTDSWYFGIDNFGLYSLAPTPAEQPVVSASLVGGAVRLAWSADAAGYVLEQRTEATSGAWTTVPGVSGNAVTLPATASQQWFRLVKP